MISSPFPGRRLFLIAGLAAHECGEHRKGLPITVPSLAACITRGDMDNDQTR